MKKLLGAILLLAAVGVKAEPVSVTLGRNTFILPLQVVSGVQLYSIDEGKGYPALETVLVERGDFHFSVGAAPVLGTNANVPFASVQTRLSPKLFDTNNNDLFFGVWAGKPSNQKDWAWGLSCSVEIW